MDNFNFKKSKKRLKPNAIDGFIRNTDKQQNNGALSNFAYNRSYQPIKEQPDNKSIDKFRSTEGFHPASQPNIVSAISVEDKPIAEQLLPQRPPQNLPPSLPQHRGKLRDLPRPRRKKKILKSVP